MCVTDRHDMTLAVKVALNPNTTNQIRILPDLMAKFHERHLQRYLLTSLSPLSRVSTLFMLKTVALKQF